MATSENTTVIDMPDLRIVPLSALVPHEEHDVQRSDPLVERIRQAGSWLNPPVVTPMDTQRFVILDGANRHHALQTLGYQYILVQVVDYESEAVQLDTWHHVVGDLSWFEFLRSIRKIPDIHVESTDVLSARAVLAQREALAYFVLKDGRAYAVSGGGHTLYERNRLLRELVDTYKQRGILNRISTDSLGAARKLYPKAVAIVVFPHYEPVEILVAARDGAYLPPGITRHVIQGRAMRLHYPLEAFREDGRTLEQKNAELRSWLQERSAQKRVRFYAEGTFVFDE